MHTMVRIKCVLVPNLPIHSKHVIISLASAQAAVAAYSTHYANVLCYTRYNVYVKKMHI